MSKTLSQATRHQAESLPKKGNVTVKSLLEGLSEEALATMLLLVSIPGLLPSTGIPFGSLFSPGMFVVGLAWLMAKNAVNLPHKITGYRLKAETARSILLQMAKAYARAEKLCKPRHTGLTHGVSLRLVGLAVMVNAIIVFLPIPFGNTLPAFANIVLALGILFRDGLAVLCGYLLTLSSLVIGTVLGLTALWAVQKLI